jgi:hypothetical protein
MTTANECMPMIIKENFAGETHLLWPQCRMFIIDVGCGSFLINEWKVETLRQQLGPFKWKKWIGAFSLLWSRRRCICGEDYGNSSCSFSIKCKYERKVHQQRRDCNLYQLMEPTSRSSRCLEHHIEFWRC